MNFVNLTAIWSRPIRLPVLTYRSSNLMVFFHNFALYTTWTVYLIFNRPFVYSLFDSKIRIISLKVDTMLLAQITHNGKNTEFECSFLIICRYMNFVKKSENNFIANWIFASCYNIKILYRLLKNMLFFIELCMKGVHFWFAHIILINNK